jgi:hypothetical protein
VLVRSLRARTGAEKGERNRRRRESPDPAHEGLSERVGRQDRR